MLTVERLLSRILAKTFLASMGMFFLLGGCTWSPFGSSKDTGDAGTIDAAPELARCSLKARACQKSCLDRGSACLECCVRNARSCDSGESYGFYSCPDAE